MNRLVIHVGPEKTGTTALQRFFTDNSSFLTRHGIAYPRTGRWIAAHHDIAIASRHSEATILRELWSEADGEETVFISSEIFASLSTNALRFFQRHSPSQNPEIVFLLRKLPDFWFSSWSERVKHGLDIPFHEYFNSAPDLDRYSWRTRALPSQQLRNLASAFGKDALRIGVYDSRLEGTDFALRFLADFLDVSTDPPGTTTRQINVGLSQARIECLRHLNKRCIASGFDRETRIRFGRLYFDGFVTVEDKIIDAFQTVCAASPKFHVNNDGFEARTELTLILDGFKECIVDPIESFTAPTKRTVFKFDDRQVPTWLETELDELFHVLDKRLKNFALPGVRRFQNRN